MLAKVTVCTPTATRHYVVAPGRLLVLGRSPDCDLCVVETSVSRRHCTLTVLDGEVAIADLGAAHGIERKGRKVEQARISAGDAVRLGAAELRVDGWLHAQAADEDPEVAERLGVVGIARVDAEHPLWTAAAKPAAPRAPAARAAASPPTAVPAAPAPTDPGPVPAPPAGDELEPGARLAGYRILERLGAGGYATVYRAEQVQLGREVALKVLRNDGAASGPDAVAAFLREARAAAALSDPRLVQVFDLGEADGRRFLSMEYVRGGTLADALRKDGPAPWRALLPIVRDVVGALQVAHKAGLVHRDVKPANILLTPERRGKLADLGLVRDIGGEGDRIGTAAYMAPEQITGAAIDRRVDVYALGSTIYHALSGAPPFQGPRKEILRRKRSETPPPLDPKLGVPAPVEQLVRERMLALDPAQRLADADAVLAELDRLERLAAAPIRRASSAARSQRAARGGGGGLWILLLLAMAAAAGWFVWRSRTGG